MAQEPIIAIPQNDFALSNEIIELRKLMQQLFGAGAVKSDEVRGYGLNELLSHQAKIPDLYRVIQKAEEAAKQAGSTSTYKGSRKKSTKSSRQHSPEASYDDDDRSVSERAEAVYTKQRQSELGDYSHDDLLDELSEAAEQASEQDSMMDDMGDSEVCEESSECDFVSMASYSVDASEDEAEPEEEKKSKKKKSASKKVGRFFSKLSRSTHIEETALSIQDIQDIRHAEEAVKILSQVDHYTLSCLILFNIITRPARNSLFVHPFWMRLPVHPKARDLFGNLHQQTLSSWIVELEDAKLFQPEDAQSFFQQFTRLKLRLAPSDADQQVTMTHNDCLDPAYFSFYTEIQDIANAVTRSRKVNDGIEQYIIEISQVNNKPLIRLMPVGKPSQFVVRQPILKYQFNEPSPQNIEFTHTPMEFLMRFQELAGEFDRVGFAQKALTEGETMEFYGLSDQLCRETAISTLPMDKYTTNKKFAEAVDKALTEIEFAPQYLKLDWYHGEPCILPTFFTCNGFTLTNLSLNFSSAVTDDIFDLLSTHCQSLRTLSLVAAPITRISGHLNQLSELNVSLCHQLDSGIYAQIEQAFPALDRLNASKTQVVTLRPHASIHHVDLSGCATDRESIDDKIFDELNRLDQRLQSLHLRNTDITTVDPDNINVDHLDVSFCARLQTIESAKRSVASRRNLKELVSLTADHCHKLTTVRIQSIQRLFEVNLRHNKALQHVEIAPNQIAPNLSVLRINDSLKIKYLHAHPLAAQIFELDMLPDLKHRLSSQLSLKLLDSAIASARPGAPSAVVPGELMFRTIPNSANWIERMRGVDALNGANFDGIDARGLSFAGLFMVKASFKGAKFAGNDFSGTVLRDANFEGATWGERASIGIPMSNVTSAVYSESGYFAAASSTGEVFIFDPDFQPVQDYLSKNPATCLAFSQQDEFLVVARREKLWVNEAKDKLEKKLQQINQRIARGDNSPEAIEFKRAVVTQLTALRLLPHDSIYLTYVYNLEKPGNMPRILYLHSDIINCAAFSADGILLATASDDKTLSVIDFKSGEVVQHHTFMTPVKTLAWSPDGKFLACHEGENLVVIEMATNQQASFIKTDTKGHSAPINAICFGPKSRQIYTGSDDGTVKHWVITRSIKDDKPRVQLMNTFRNHRAEVKHLQLLPDSKHIVVGCTTEHEGEIVVRGLTYNRVCQKITTIGPLNCFAIAPDEERPEEGWQLTTGSHNNSLGQHLIDGDIDPHPRFAPRHNGQAKFHHCDISGTRGLSHNTVTLFKQHHAEGKPWDPSQEKKTVKKKKRVRRKAKASKLEKMSSQLHVLTPVSDESAQSELPTHQPRK